MVKRKNKPKKDASFSAPDNNNNNNNSPLKKTEEKIIKKNTQLYKGALREIRKLQKSTNLLIPKAPFLRLVSFFYNKNTI
jgi:hypothetical protein